MTSQSKKRTVSPLLCLLAAALFALWPLGFEHGEPQGSGWIGFLAALHPVILHLPIGILVAIFIYELWSAFNPEQHSLRKLLWMAAAASASLSFITGYFLGEEKSAVDVELVRHLWAAAILTSLSWLALGATLRFTTPRISRFLLGLNLATMTIAGHYGGLMVHGDPLARAPWAKEGPAKANVIVIKDENILVYHDLIAPLLEAKCSACHDEKKKEGKLRLDSYQAIMAGGGDGECLEPGNADHSLMIELMEYPIDDEDHMPPEDEPQLTDFEHKVLRWWIDEGATEDMTVAKSEAPDFVLPMLAPDYKLVPPSE